MRLRRDWASTSMANDGWGNAFTFEDLQKALS